MRRVLVAQPRRVARFVVARPLRVAFLIVAVLASGRYLAAQAVPAEAPRIQSAKAVAPSDLTGYWVSVVTEDWIERMITPPRGEYAGIPLTAAGRQTADNWDPADDTAKGNQCRAYGAAGVMRQPGRLHITWQDDNTLKIETDAGTQTRLLHFAAAAAANAAAKPELPSWQGRSAARWNFPGNAGGSDEETIVAGGRPGRGRAGPQSLKVVTTNMKPGYLRLNGVPYSEKATLTEYFDRVPGANSGPAPYGASWLMVFSVVEDPVNLTQPFITSEQFKLEPDGSKWKPRPCTSTLPIRGK